MLSDFVELTEPLETLRMTLHINNTLAQFANYDLMIYKPQTMLDEIASFMTFEDGDIIMSGTPKGVAVYHHGDRFVGRVYSNDKLLVEKEWRVE